MTTKSSMKFIKIHFLKLSSFKQCFDNLVILKGGGKMLLVLFKFHKTRKETESDFVTCTVKLFTAVINYVT